MSCRALPPAVNISVPYIDNLLHISPYFPLFLEKHWPFNEFLWDERLPNDPSLSGMTVLYQALVGPFVDGPLPKRGSWTNCVEVTFQ